MGNWCSGRTGGKPTAEASLRIDLGWMIRTERAIPGKRIDGILQWTCGGAPSGSISYAAIMDEPERERLELAYTRGRDGQREDVEQTIALCHTTPHYGGKRWWMVCPYQGCRVGMLYKPPTGDRFASRKAWGIGYRIQRVSHRDRPFERLHSLQKKLGQRQGWDKGLPRPKGMWRSTHQKHLARFFQLEAECAQAMDEVFNALRRQLDKSPNALA